MENTNNSPEELNPTNGNENNDNLQNDSEENTQNANTDKNSPVHVPGMIERSIEEGAQEDSRKIAEEDGTANTPPKRDRSLLHGDEEDLEINSEENQEQEDTETNANSKKRYNKRNNRRIANLKRTKEQKEKKLARLKSECGAKKDDLERGYLLVPLGAGTNKVKQVKLDPSDKEIIKAFLSEKEVEIFDLNQEIKKIKLEIKEKASAKTSANKNKLSKKKQAENEDNLVKRVNKELTNASKNGKQKLVSEIESQVKAGDSRKAYNSLKSFLSEQVKPIAKKLDKSEEVEKNVLDRVLEKLSKVQS